MPEADAEGARFYADQPQTAPGFFLKGSHQLDWGMKNRLARVFSPTTGRTVMLFVTEPLILHRWLLARAEVEPQRTYRRVEWLHRILLIASLITVFGAVAGSHGMLLFE